MNHILPVATAGLPAPLQQIGICFVPCAPVTLKIQQFVHRQSANSARPFRPDHPCRATGRRARGIAPGLAPATCRRRLIAARL